MLRTDKLPPAMVVQSLNDSHFVLQEQVVNVSEEGDLRVIRFNPLDDLPRFFVQGNFDGEWRDITVSPGGVDGYVYSRSARKAMETVRDHAYPYRTRNYNERNGNDRTDRATFAELTMQLNHLMHRFPDFIVVDMQMTERPWYEATVIYEGLDGPVGQRQWTVRSVADVKVMIHEVASANAKRIIARREERERKLKGGQDDAQG